MTYRTVIGALLLAATAVGLLLIQADRQIIVLSPSEDASLVVPLISDKIYEQEFVNSAANISRVGVYVKPLVQDIPVDTITLNLRRSGENIGQQVFPSSFLNANAPVFLRLSSPFETVHREKLVLAISVPPSLSGKVGLMQRQQDETFNRDAVLFIDGAPQSSPAAYEVFMSVRPAITLQMGGLLLIAATFLIVWHRSAKHLLYPLYAIGLSVSASLPLLVRDVSIQSFLLVVLQAGIVWGVLFLLKRRSLRPPATLFGAHIAAFTTFWALVIAGRVPWTGLTSLGHLKDVFLDPNQIAVMPIGAYIGIPALICTGIGLILLWRQSRRVFGSSIIFITIGCFITPILTVLAIAYTSAVGLAGISSYLRSHGKIAELILYALTFLALLDLLAVYARVIELAL
ncbi:MAG: hypothetical protein HYZ61_00250 [Candidatus Andersenbacteria bacterium]|nr:hypothetical protein [Candidatus Andersenbacteria bacterium]